jgi:hypothetical protein
MKEALLKELSPNTSKASAAMSRRLGSFLLDRKMLDMNFMVSQVVIEVFFVNQIRIRIGTLKLSGLMGRPSGNFHIILGLMLLWECGDYGEKLVLARIVWTQVLSECWIVIPHWEGDISSSLHHVDTRDVALCI